MYTDAGDSVIDVGHYDEGTLNILTGAGKKFGVLMTNKPADLDRRPRTIAMRRDGMFLVTFDEAPYLLLLHLKFVHPIETTYKLMLISKGMRCILNRTKQNKTFQR